MALIAGRNKTALMATPSPIPQTYLQKETTNSVIPSWGRDVRLLLPLYLRSGTPDAFNFFSGIIVSRKKNSNINQIPEKRQLIPAIYQLHKMHTVTARTSLQTLFLLITS